MMSTNQKNQYQYYSRKYKLHAKFLKKNLSITTSESQALVARYYDLNTQENLNSVIKSSNIAESFLYPEGRLLSQVDRKSQQKTIEKVFNSCTKDIFSHLHIKENTVSHCLEKKKYDWLLDLEVAHLYESLTDERVVNNLTNSELTRILADCDNNITTRIKHNFKRNKPLFNNVHIYDHRYCVELYMDFKFQEKNKVNIIFRELCLPIFLTNKQLFSENRIEYFSDIFAEHWFQKLTLVYITNTIKNLHEIGFTGNLYLETLSGVKVHELADPRLKSKGFAVMLQKLKEIGATNCKPFYGQDGPSELLIHF